MVATETKQSMMGCESTVRSGPLAVFKWRMCASAAILAISSILSGADTPATAETLREALAAAYKYNPTLDAQRATLRAQDEEVARANSGYRPTLQGQADLTYQNTNLRPDAPSVEGVVHPRDYSLTAVQPVFRGFRVLNAVREAESNTRAAREQLRSVEQDTLLAATQAYMDVVRDQAIVRLRENNVNVLSRELKATQDRFAVGEVTRTDVAQAQARRAQSVSQLDLARSNLKTSRATFERVVGSPPTNLTLPATPERLLPKTIDEALAITNREAPIIVQALYLEQASRATVDKIWGELLPSVDVTASYKNTLEPNRSVDQNETTSIVGRLQVPLYEGGEVRARVRQAKHNHVSRLQNIEKARSEAQERTVQQWSRLLASRAQLQSDQVNVESTRVALQGVREEERVGQRTLLDVLNAELEALNAEVQFTATQHDVVVNTYALISAIGRMNAQELGLTSSIYDPEAHYDEVRRKWFGISITHADGRREEFNTEHSRYRQHAGGPPSAPAVEGWRAETAPAGRGAGPAWRTEVAPSK